MMQALKNLIRRGQKESTVDAQRAVVSCLGKSQKAFVVIPWGMESNPPAGTMAVILQQEANEESLLAMLTAVSGRSTLASGEVAFGSPESTTRWKARPDGSVTIVINEVDGGDFLARFNELKSGFDELLADHNDLVTKWNAFAGAYVPGSPTVQGTPPTASTDTASTASIDDAKIDELEVP